MEIIGAFARSAAEHGVELAHDDVSKFVISGGGAEEVGIDLRGVLNVGARADQNLEQLGIGDGFGALGISEQSGNRGESVALLIEPYGAAFAGFRGKLYGGDARAETFGFALALARFNIEP